MTAPGRCRASPLGCAAPAIAVALAAAAPLAAQGTQVGVGRAWMPDRWNTVAAGAHLGRWGPFSASGLGHLLSRDTTPGELLVGAGADLHLFRDFRGLYAVVGLAAGLQLQGGGTAWTGSSLGVGYDLPLVGGVVLSPELRYQRLSQEGRSRDGIAAGLGVLVGTGPARARRTRGARPTADAEALGARVAASARRRLGMSYQYGGTGGAGEGLDCSALIQLAYGEHGLALPRQSADQARAGAALPRDVAALRAGDILTFSDRGDGRITHVGLYLGDGRFIHSASDGVREDELSTADPNGRWWYQRWVGARRVAP